MRSAILVLLMLAFCAWTAAEARQDEIKKKKSQLEKLRSDISSVEQRIKEKEKKEHATLGLLDAYDHQASLIRRLIQKLHEEEQSLQQDIDSTRERIAELSGQVSFLKKQYAEYVTAAYTRGRSYDIELLFSSASVNQMLIRSEYLKRFTDQRRQDINKIEDQRTELQQQNQRLQQQLTEQRQLINEKSSEEGKLAQRTKKRKVMLAAIRKDKNTIKQEMARKLQAAKELEELISTLIEQERQKKEHEPKERGGAAAKPGISAGTFENHRGRLRWPVSGGKITAHFGAHENPVLHTVTQNPGIDIAVNAGTTVSSVADGEVSAIWWLPSFGNLVIVNHRNGYRSVYAHLGEISVSDGAQVAEGQAIGKSGEAVSGPLLHFEIWKDREKLDPEQWLGQRGLSQR